MYPPFVVPHGDKSVFQQEAVINSAALLLETSLVLWWESAGSRGCLQSRATPGRGSGVSASLSLCREAPWVISGQLFRNGELVCSLFMEIRPRGMSPKVGKTHTGPGMQTQDLGKLQHLCCHARTHLPRPAPRHPRGRPG